MTEDGPDTDIVNDPWNLAIHEAGHAVVAHVLGLPYGNVTVEADDDSAGHIVLADQWGILEAWEKREKWCRDEETAIRARTMCVMAGREAEEECLGHCEGGDGDDQYWVVMMLDSSAIPAERLERWEARLRRHARGLVRRHRSAIEHIARELMAKQRLSSAAVMNLLKMAEGNTSATKTNKADENSESITGTVT